MVLKYKRPFWCDKGTERDIEMQFMYKWLTALKPQNLLDVGFAGSGYIDMILDLGINYCGIDSNHGRITGDALSIPEKSRITMSKQHWREILKKISYIHGDIIKYDSYERRLLPDFDLTISISTIEHMIYSQYGAKVDDIKAVDNIKRTVKKDGHLMLTFPCGIEMQLPNRDILIYDKNRIKRVIGDWQVVDEKYYICDKEFEQVTSLEALSYLHTQRDVKSLCCLLLKK